MIFTGILSAQHLIPWKLSQSSEEKVSTSYPAVYKLGTDLKKLAPSPVPLDGSLTFALQPKS